MAQFVTFFHWQQQLGGNLFYLAQTLLVTFFHLAQTLLVTINIEHVAIFDGRQDVTGTAMN